MSKNSNFEKSNRSPKERAWNSVLQDRMLLALEQAPADSVTALAERVGAHRASVSRAINALKTRDLVAKEGKTWSLSEAGSAEVVSISEKATARARQATQQAERALQPLAERASRMGRPSNVQLKHDFEQISQAAEAVAKFQEMKPTMNDMMKNAVSPSAVEMALQSLNSASSILDQGRIGSIAAIPRSGLDMEALAKSYRLPGLMPDMSVAFAALQTPPNLGQQLMQSYDVRPQSIIDLTQNLTTNRFLSVDLLGDFSRSYDVAAQSFLSSQKINLDLLVQASSCGGLGTISDAVLEQTRGGLGNLGDYSALIARGTAINSSLGRIMGDMETMRLSALEGVLPSSAVYQMTGLETIATGYGSYMGDVATYVPHWGDLDARQRAIYDPWLPTQATESLVRRTRETIVPEDETETRAPIIEVIIEYRESWQDIEDLLAQFAPRLAPKWRGAWETLNGEGGDRYCQAAHSAREVLTQLLHIGAPDEAFSAEETREAPGKKPTRKMRFRRMMESKKAAGWAESAAFLIDDTYDRLSGVAHSHEETIERPLTLALLEATQSLLRYVLTILLAK